MPTGDNQQPLSVKKLALRDLPNETRNSINMPQGSPLTKGKGPFPDALKVSGMKRHNPDCTSTAHHQSACNSGTNGHLVYVRRKVEETGKHSAGVLNTTVPPTSTKISNCEQNELTYPRDQVQEAKVSCFPALSPIPAASLTISSRGPSFPYTVGLSMNDDLAVEPTSSVFSTAMPAQSNSPSACSVHWKERFLRLQIFLNKCDQSNQEEYIQMLRSLTAIGRSKHAVELEKRAIHLLLEEAEGNICGHIHMMKLIQRNPRYSICMAAIGCEEFESNENSFNGEPGASGDFFSSCHQKAVTSL